MDRRNVNRWFKQLRVWQDEVGLYVMACRVFCGYPFELRKTAANAIDAAHSISRNIAEWYCRGRLREYLNHLNIALGSCGESHSCYESFRQANQIGDADCENLDRLHYKVENGLLKLIGALQRKQINGEWLETTLPSEE